MCASPDGCGAGSIQGTIRPPPPAAWRCNGGAAGGMPAKPCCWCCMLCWCWCCEPPASRDAVRTVCGWTAAARCCCHARTDCRMLADGCALCSRRTLCRSVPYVSSRHVRAATLLLLCMSSTVRLVCCSLSNTELSSSRRHSKTHQRARRQALAELLCHMARVLQMLAAHALPPGGNCRRSGPSHRKPRLPAETQLQRWQVRHAERRRPECTVPRRGGRGPGCDRAAPHGVVMQRRQTPGPQCAQVRRRSG